MYSNITDDSIKLYANKHGYDGYIPYDLIRDIMKCHFYESVYGNFEAYIDGRTKYQNDLVDLMKSIEIDLNISSIAFAIKLLKLISKRINLRSIGDHGIVYENTPQLNYDVDLSTYDECIHELLDIDKASYNAKELDEDILNILRKTQGITIGSGYDKEYLPSKRQMRHYEDLIKVSATARMMPDFDLKFSQKQLFIKNQTSNYVSKNEKILAIDISASANKEIIKQYIYTGAIVLAPLFKIDGFTLDLHLFGCDVFYSYTVTSIQQLKAICENKHVDPEYKKGWRRTANFIHDNYQNKEIVIVTDGTEENIFADKWCNNRIYAISDIANTKLMNLCKKTNGKFFVK